MAFSRRLGALMLALLFLAGPAFSAAAEEGLPPGPETGQVGAPGPETTPETGPVPEPEGDPVSSWEELTAWLDENWDKGGAVRLTRDVTAEESYDFMTSGNKQVRLMKDMTVDCGPYTIYIDGGPENPVCLVTTGFHLTIQGQGGENGLLHVKPGGFLMLDMLNIAAGSADDCAVVQDEGGVLVVTQEGKDYQAPPRVTGQIVYARQAVLIDEGLGQAGLAVVPEGTDLTSDLLPGTATVKVNENGTLSKRLDWPVEWDLSSGGGALEDRVRTTVTGRFNGTGTDGEHTWDEGDYLSLYTPECLVVFEVDGAALLNVYLTGDSGYLASQIYFRVPAGAERVELLTSADGGGSWTVRTSKPGDRVEWERDSLPLNLEDPAYPLWVVVQGIYPDGTAVLTDVLELNGGDATPAAWVDGHRGSGAPLLEPEPPLTTPGPGSENPGTPGGDDDPAPGTPTPTRRPTAPSRPDPTPSPAPDPTPVVSEAPAPTATPEPSPAATPEPTPVETAEPMPTEPPQPTPTEAAEPVVGVVSPPPEPAAPSSGSPPPRGTAPPADTPIVTQPPAPVQSPAPEPDAPPTDPPWAETAPPPAPSPAPEETGQGAGLPPAAQVALGCGAVAAVGGGAVAALNPDLLRRLLDLLRRKP